MPRMRVRPVVPALLALACANVPAADAGECRATVGPLLRAAAPAAADLAAADRLCTDEAAAGDADARYQLALLRLGAGGRWEPESAIPLVRAAAAGGISEAQYWLAWQSEEGPLLSHDQAVALDWYRQAAASRHRLALDRLARAYEKGELGLTPDPREALRLRAQIRQCAEQQAAASR